MAKLGAKSVVNGLEFQVLPNLSMKELKYFTLEGHDGLTGIIKVKSGDTLKIIEEPKNHSKERSSLVVGWENKRTKETGFCYWYWFKDRTEHIANSVIPKSNKKEVKILSTGALDGLDIRVSEMYVADYELADEGFYTMCLTFEFPGEFKGAKWISDKILKRVKKNPYFKSKLVEEIEKNLKEVEKTHSFYQDTISNSNAMFLGKKQAQHRIGTELRSGEFFVEIALVNNVKEVMKYVEFYLDYFIRAKGLPMFVEEK